MIVTRLIFGRLLAVVGLLLLASPAWTQLAIEDGYVRGLPPGQPVTAAFMRLVNNSEQPITIIAAASTSAERAEIHAHRHHNGMMSMQRVDDGIVVPAKGDFVLLPGKYHLMLINLHRTLAEGDWVDIELSVENGETVTARLPVRSVLNEHKHH